MATLKALSGKLAVEEITAILSETYSDKTKEIDFESFLRVYKFYIYTSIEELDFTHTNPAIMMY